MNELTVLLATVAHPETCVSLDCITVVTPLKQEGVNGSYAAENSLMMTPTHAHSHTTWKLDETCTLFVCRCNNVLH